MGDFESLLRLAVSKDEYSIDWFLLAKNEGRHQLRNRLSVRLYLERALKLAGSKDSDDLRHLAIYKSSLMSCLAPTPTAENSPEVSMPLSQPRIAQQLVCTAFLHFSPPS